MSSDVKIVVTVAVITVGAGLTALLVNRLLSLLPDYPLADLEDRKSRQGTVGSWVLRSFGEAESMSLPQRGLRLHEEATETAQSAGVTREEAHRIVDYVYDRPAGVLAQEIGGVSVTLLAMGFAAGIDVDQAEVAEIQRILSKPLEHWQGRNKAKNDAGLRSGAL